MQMNKVRAQHVLSEMVSAGSIEVANFSELVSVVLDRHGTRLGFILSLLKYFVSDPFLLHNWPYARCNVQEI